PLDLAPGATGTLNTTIPMSAILAASDGQFGQWQVGVGLIDAEGVAVQSQQESYSFASSRFTDAESGHGYAGQPYALSVTSASEEYPYNSPAVFTYNVFNHSDQEQTFQVRWNMIHHSWYNVPGYNGSLNITVPAQSFATVDSLLERVVDLDRVRATLYLNNQRVAYAERGFWVVPARMTQTVTSDKTEYSWGESPVITVVTSNQAAVETPVEASLMALAPDRTTITAEAESFTLDPNGNHTFQITLPPVTAAGQYDVSVENSVYGRVALRGAARFSVAPLQARVTADLPAELTPSSSFSLNVANPGRGQLPTPTLEVSLADPTGAVLWSDQRALETLDPAQSLDESFTLSLSPITALGNYKLSYHVVSAGQTLGAGSTTLPVKLSLEATLDQASYRIRETANLAVTLRNTGRFELAPALLVSSADLGLDDTQSLVIPAGGSQSLAYQATVPDTLLPGSYAIQVSYALGSGDSASRAPSVVILPARVLTAMDQTAVDAGDTIVVTLDNPGGVDAPVEDSLHLVDRYGRTVAQVDHADVILAGDSIQVAIDVPAGTVTGDYEFKITGT
ncbi:MAG: hypothetical protein KC487_13935, partial [Anaerolineae bacterium]|nr:hypothetical protein [Anaerolineae bacterium]